MELFRKNMEKRCAYCVHGVTISDTEVACARKGIVGAGGHCFRFAYDPLRRVPARPAPLENGKYSAEDFKL